MTTNNKPSTFCVLPWISINSTPTGSARLCCLSSVGPNGGAIADGSSVHNLGTSNFDDIINSEYLKKIRLSLLNGEKIPECQTCSLKEKLNNGTASRRLAGLKTFKDVMTEEKARVVTLDDGTIPVEIAYLDLRFGNLCNLRCISCYPASSTQWYETYVKLNDNTTFDDNGRIIQLVKDENGRYRDNGEFNWSESEVFWNNIDKHLPFLKQIYFTGGEPLLLDMHYTFLSKIIESGYANQITLEYDTNLMAVKPALKGIWSKFKKVLLSISLDDYDKQNEYVRYLSSWTTIQKNITKLQEWNLANTTISFSVTWHILNSFTFTNVIDFLISKKLNKFHVRILHQPTWLDCRGLPRSVKDELLRKYKQWSKENNSVASSIIHLIALLEDNSYQERKNDMQWFFDNVSKLDEMHKTNWKMTFPELQQSLAKHYE